MSRTKRDTRSVCGFTLVELLAAVAIVGVLATIAMPRYRAFIARSRSAEAKVNLATILSLERSYFYEYDKHVTPTISYGPCGSPNCGSNNLKNELGFRTDSCTDLRYVYSDLGVAFGAQANSSGCEVYPGCGTTKVDHWVINSAGKLNHQDNVIKECKD